MTRKMVAMESFEVMLSGGHSNSLGRTVEVVDLILSDNTRLEELYQCYFSENELVRLRTSNAFKRIWRDQPEWLALYIDRFISEISQIEQASTQWTIAQLFLELQTYLSDEQKSKAIPILKANLKTSEDWIVLNNTMQTLGEWAEDDKILKVWLLPELEKLADDKRKSVAKRANKLLLQLNG